MCSWKLLQSALFLYQEFTIQDIAKLCILNDLLIHNFFLKLLNVLFFIISETVLESPPV